MPGPATQAWTCPAALMTCPPVVSSVVVMTASGQCCLTTAAAGWADTRRTIPAPPRTAAPTDSCAAPVNRSLPATIPRTPRRYLSDSAAGRGSQAATSAAWAAATAGGPRYRPRPISTSSTTPAWEAPGSMSRPGFQADVTVTFGTGKPGLLIVPGASHAGVVELVDIGLGRY